MPGQEYSKIAGILRAETTRVGWVVCHLMLVGCWIASAANSQSIVPDGGTATTVTIGAEVQEIVGIAPVQGPGVSHNTYSQFSISPHGAVLDNTRAGAALIVNEVTSSAPSTIRGPLSVSGDAAHVVVANPNGVTVDGGRFVNTGNVALTTGSVAFDPVGRPVATITGGQVTIGEGGISGQMAGLDLLAQRIRVTGSVSLDDTGGGDFSITAGQNTVTFDDSSQILPFARVQSIGISGSDAVVVDITRSAAVSAGRIRVAVTEDGAGVHLAGANSAGAGGLPRNCFFLT